MRARMMMAACAMALAATGAAAQPSKPQERNISTYRAAPGMQMQLLRYLANQDAALRAIGAPACEMFAHHEGASWDYLSICSVLTREQEKAYEVARGKMGLPSGPAEGLELRKTIAEHSDSWVDGPMSATDMLRAVGEAPR
ncbi:MAG: hypothetical protein RQ833_10545 [Sphingomonadaceae bacterium]|nr:hypothetical protein [Sphingomonadaceae bacterium]